MSKAKRNSSDVSQTINLNCFILGNHPTTGFEIEIAKTAKVGALKELIKAKNSPALDKVTANLLNIWKVDVNIDDDLDQILISDDPLVGLGLEHERQLSYTIKLSQLFPDEPNEAHLHIIVQRPDDGSAQTRAIAKVYRKNPVLFKCLQVIVSKLEGWKKEDVRNNQDGGNFFNHDANRTCQVLARIEARMAQPRTYSVLPGQESQELQIARRYNACFNEIFVETQAPSPAVNDDREFAAFFNVLRWYRPDAERIQTKEYASLKASTLIVYFILPPFFSRRTERFACKVEVPWAFPVFIATPEMAGSWGKYRPKSDCMVTSISFLCPFIISEVISNEQETDRHHMLLQAIATARAGQYLMKTGERFFVVAIYLTANLMAERYIVAQTELHQDGQYAFGKKVVLGSRPKVSIAQKNFNLSMESEAVSFLREMYNLAPMLDDLAGKFDPNKKTCLSEIMSAADGVLSLTKMAKENKSIVRTMDSVPEGREGDGADDDLGVFGADDIQDVLEAMEFRISFILFGHPHIAVVSHLVDDSKNGYLKFVPSGRKEIKILQYLTQIDSTRNHTISGVGIWPVHGGHVISMPMAGTWLTHLHEPSGRLWSVAEQLFEAIDFMHQHGVAHMDLKPANILIPLHGGRLSIIDFNTSVRVKGVETMFRGIVGTPGYIAPEVASGRGLYSAVRADLWSCGKTLYEFCKCCQPSADRNVLLEIAGQLMDDDPEKRPMISDVLEMVKKCKAGTDTGMNCLRYSSLGSAEVSA